MQVEAVFFDVGNTLIYPHPSVGEVYARALRSAGVAAEPERMEEEFRAAWQRLRAERGDAGGPEYGTTREEALKWWRDVVAESFRPFGMPDDFEDVFLRLYDYFASGSAWRVFPDALPAVSELRRRGKGVGLISNWDVRLEEVLAELDLLERFDWVVISAVVGVEKPGRAIFEHALRQCSLPAAQVMHVGDSYEDDVLGARRAGLKALWLRRDGDAEGEDIVSGLDEVPAAVD